MLGCSILASASSRHKCTRLSLRDFLTFPGNSSESISSTEFLRKHIACDPGTHAIAAPVRKMGTGALGAAEIQPDKDEGKSAVDTGMISDGKISKF